jgi:methylated-DNA-[protein]-cysteine S-methyltransferase
MNGQFYRSFYSSFDSFTIVWKEIDSKTQIARIFLSDPELKSDVKALKEINLIKKESSPSIELLGEQIQKFLEGENVKFDLQLIDLDQCSEIQKKVLLAEYGIPRGYISTYKRIADEIGIPKGARAVGNALAKNPFPIIIPCHRAIKSNGALGGFQGGIEMKRKLLKMEGIAFSNREKVLMNKIYY